MGQLPSEEIEKSTDLWRGQSPSVCGVINLEKKSRFGTHILLLLLFVLYFAYALFLYAPCDDAYIHLVYVKNMLTGNGLTFNGDYVQGFSSLIWPLLISVFGLLGLDLVQASVLLSFISGIFVVLVVYWATLKSRLSVVSTIAPIFLLVFSGDFAFYATSGMETGLFAGVLFLTLYMGFLNDRYEKSPTLPILAAILVLLRPEGVLFSVLFLVWKFLEKKTKLIFRYLIIYGAVLVPVFIGLASYYGDVLPNTFYAKSGAGFANIYSGISYSTRFVAYYLPIFMLFFWGLFSRKLVENLKLLPVLAFVGVWVAQISIQGGDNFVGFRVYLPLLPMLYFIIYYLLNGKDHKKVILFSCWSSLFLLVVYLGNFSVGSTWHMRVRDHANAWTRDFYERKRIGMWLKDSFPKDTIVAVNAAGIIPYYSEMPTIDMLGLNNRYIAIYGKKDRNLPYAHQAGDGDYVLRQRPGVILFQGYGSLEPGPFVSDREIAALSEFKDNYDACKVTDNAWAWVRKDLIKEQCLMASQRDGK